MPETLSLNHYSGIGIDLYALFKYITFRFLKPKPFDLY